MPRISNFYGIAIWIYWTDHYPAHFHAEYGEHEILIRIEDLSIYTGFLPPRAFSLVMEWALLHQEELKECWELASKGLKPNKIAPLK